MTWLIAAEKQQTQSMIPLLSQSWTHDDDNDDDVFFSTSCRCTIFVTSFPISVPLNNHPLFLIMICDLPFQLQLHCRRRYRCLL